jgi:hypothetical protein
MSLESFFVSGVAVILGSLVLAGAVLNVEWYFHLRKARWVESWAGRNGARVVFGLLGGGLIVLGIAIAMGFSPTKAMSRRDSDGRRLSVVRGNDLALNGPRRLNPA